METINLRKGEKKEGISHLKMRRWETINLRKSEKQEGYLSWRVGSRETINLGKSKKQGGCLTWRVGSREIINISKSKKQGGYLTWRVGSSRRMFLVRPLCGQLTEWGSRASWPAWRVRSRGDISPEEWEAGGFRCDLSAHGCLWGVAGPVDPLVPATTGLQVALQGTVKVGSEQIYIIPFYWQNQMSSSLKW